MLPWRSAGTFLLAWSSVGWMGKSSVSEDATECVRAEDCNLNGECSEGQCVCKSWWTGPTCHALNLEPVEDLTSGIYQPNVSTWGAGVVRGEDGLIHAFAAEFTQGCGVRAWQSNSQCVHFTAADPMGPFTRRGMVMPVWCHNPSVTVLPKGQWLFYHVGFGTPGKSQYTNCSNGETHGKPGDDLRLVTNKVGLGFTSVLSASGPFGPWTDQHIPTTTSTGWPAGGISNPAPLPPHSLNGRDDFLVMFCARNEYHTCADGHCSLLGIMRSQSWNTTYVMDRDPVCSGVGCINGSAPNPRQFCEDPFVWTDSDGTYHQICNSKDMGELGNGYGMHAFSRDGVRWMWSPEPAYNTTLRLVNGSVHKLGRRERPHLLFDGSGVPTHLYNAVTGAVTQTQSDRSHTFVQRLRTVQYQYVSI